MKTTSIMFMLATRSLKKSNYVHVTLKKSRIDSIDLLRGTVMIIMVIDHVRDYFHKDALIYDPTDLTKTNAILFFTRFITHYCAPVFIFLAGVSAYLAGTKKTKRELSFFLLTRGLWLILTDLFIVSLFRTFNPAYVFTNLQVIWVIGLSMILLAGIIHFKRTYILITAIVLIGAHNLLDNVHFPGNGLLSFGWSVLHEPHEFKYGPFIINVLYPLLPWLGLMTMGYFTGIIYRQGFRSLRRKNLLIIAGFSCLLLFIILRSHNLYGDMNHWSIQKSAIFSQLSFINVTKYPPSLLYILITIGPALIFLAFSERPLNRVTEKIKMFGRVAMFFYLAHILLIHLLASFAAVLTGYKLSDMVLSSRVQSAASLRGFGFNLWVVYVVWLCVILMLYPLCRWYDNYKTRNLPTKPYLSYL